MSRQQRNLPTKKASSWLAFSCIVELSLSGPDRAWKSNRFLVEYHASRSDFNFNTTVQLTTFSGVVAGNR